MGGSRKNKHLSGAIKIKYSREQELYDEREEEEGWIERYLSERQTAQQWWCQLQQMLLLHLRHWHTLMFVSLTMSAFTPVFLQSGGPVSCVSLYSVCSSWIGIWSVIHLHLHGNKPVDSLLWSVMWAQFILQPSHSHRVCQLCFSTGICSTHCIYIHSTIKLRSYSILSLFV